VRKLAQTERRQSPGLDVFVLHRRTCVTAIWSILAVLFLGACAGGGITDTRAAPTTERAQPTESVLSSYRSARTYSETAAPVRLRIPAIDVDTDLEKLGLEPDGSIQVPQRPSRAGWWTGGPRPGQVGPAVIMGHVNSTEGPEVFYHLDDLTAGDEILVDRADGTTARFEVKSLGQYWKTRFPSDLVYYPTLKPELRLVTCGGPIDQSTGRHRDNIVVFAIQAP
jgi:hypothetical protein